MKKRLIIGLTCFLILGLAIGIWTSFHKEVHSTLSEDSSFHVFTLTHSDTNIPCFHTEIEGISFLAKFDTGYDGVISLPKPLLEQLTYKKADGTVHFANIQGKEYENSVYTIPKLSIGNLHLTNLSVEESNLDFERDISSGSDHTHETITARLGWSAFSGSILYIDLQNSLAICCNNLQILQKKGYSLENFISTSLSSMEFEANIDNRKVKCLLDTGCTINLFHKSIENLTSELGHIDLANPLPPAKISISELDLGSCVFHETQLPFNAEAIIGIDFLETQIFCIDFIENRLFFKPNAN